MTGHGSGRPDDSREWSTAYVSKRSNSPRLAPSAVLYVDLLGIREMTRKRAAANLRRLQQAVQRAYRNFLHEKSPWPAATFSDTLVVASPLLPGGDEESAIVGLVSQAARLQLELLEAGFFSRGALSWGKFHIHEGLIFGPALVDAADLEQKVAISPRILVSDEAQSILEKSAAGPAGARPLMLLRDADGQTFIHYLALLLDDPDDPRPRLEKHRDVVVQRLREDRDNKAHWEKYRWLAEYHNAFVDNAMGGDAGLRIATDDLTWRFDPFP